MPDRRSQLERHLHLLHMVEWMLLQPAKASRQAAALELNRWLAGQARAAALAAGSTEDEAAALAAEAQLPEALAKRQIKHAEQHVQRAVDVGMRELLRRQHADVEDRMEWVYCELSRVEAELYGSTKLISERPDGGHRTITVEPPLDGQERDRLRERIDRLDQRLADLRLEARAVVGGLEWERREREIRKALKAADRLPAGEGRQQAIYDAQTALLNAVAGRMVNPVTAQIAAGNRDRAAGALARVKLVQGLPGGDGAAGQGAPEPARMVVEHLRVEDEETTN